MRNAITRGLSCNEGAGCLVPCAPLLKSSALPPRCDTATIIAVASALRSVRLQFLATEPAVTLRPGRWWSLLWDERIDATGGLGGHDRVDRLDNPGSSGALALAAGDDRPTPRLVVIEGKLDGLRHDSPRLRCGIRTAAKRPSASQQGAAETDSQNGRQRSDQPIDCAEQPQQETNVRPIHSGGDYPPPVALPFRNTSRCVDATLWSVGSTPAARPAGDCAHRQPASAR